MYIWKLCGIILFYSALTAARPGKKGNEKKGLLATAAVIPYLASIQCLGHHVCGASIISSRWMLTAAHCFDGVDISNFVVVYGTRQTIDPRGIICGIDHVFVHAMYRKGCPGYNIGLVRTSGEIVETDCTRPIKLSAKYMPAGVQPSVAVWVAEYMGGPRTSDLQYLGGSTIDNVACMACLGNVSDDAVCVQHMPPTTCDDDTGGPLVFNSFQIGIIVKRNPSISVFTRVSCYCDWINEIMDNYDILSQT